MGLLWLLLGVVLNGVAFFGLRYLAARATGVRGMHHVLGVARRPWDGVSLPRRAGFALAGPVGCYLCAATLIAIGARERVTPGGPAAEAGMLDNDRVVSADGVPIANWDQLKEAVASHAGRPIPIVVQRRDQEVRLTPKPGSNAKLGIRAPSEHQDVPFFAAVSEGLSTPLKIWALAARSFANVLVGREGEKSGSSEELVAATTEVAASGAGHVLALLGALTAYFLWFPTVLALVFFPRKGRGLASS